MGAIYLFLGFMVIHNGLPLLINNFLDDMALSTCTAISASVGKIGYVAAVRRKCEKPAPDCNSVCKDAGKVPWRGDSMYHTCL